MLIHVHFDRERSGSDGRPLKLRHPCLSPDFVQNYSRYACNEPNTSNHKNLNSQVYGSQNIDLVGDLNWEQCKRIATAVAINSSNLDLVQPKLGTGCKSSLNSSGSSKILDFPDDICLNGHFHALSGFFAVYNMLNLNPGANLTKIWEKGRELCSNSWADTGSIPRNWNDIGWYCFRVPYMVSLIEDGLCLGNKEILFGPGDITWTLGASLVEGQYLWLSTAKTNLSSHKNMKAIYSSIFVFLLLLCLSFIVYCSQIKLPMLGRRLLPNGPSKPSYTSLKRMPR
uniref:Uncharacterized protein MANES_14G063500 n=1 Tax=Rhizophora mucronata TaxID=61149 RepID=A0A2P2IHT7_RHIMU